MYIRVRYPTTHYENLMATAATLVLISVLAAAATQFPSIMTVSAQNMTILRKILCHLAFN